MLLFEIKVNGRFIDEVYYPVPKSIDEVKKEFQKYYNTKNVKVRKLSR